MVPLSVNYYHYPHLFIFSNGALSVNYYPHLFIFPKWCIISYFIFQECLVRQSSLRGAHLLLPSPPASQRHPPPPLAASPPPPRLEKTHLPK